ncbi:MAG: AraC family transcriptional regulator [Roseburia sp.]|nr:AraC family transcriptional regulator [Roseburia sp.]MDY5884663.1 AraC family transcriptional regulator [Roseburia sp.]
MLNVFNGNSFPRNPGFRVMHWHEDIQFIYVLDGEIEVVTLENCISLQKGEGIFINKNVVHLVDKIDACHYNSFVFPNYFLRFYVGSPAEQIVGQIIGKDTLPIFKIADTKGNQSVLQALKNLSALEQNKTGLYPYEVLSTLSVLWLEFCRIININAQNENKKNSQISNRMAIFLQYMELHYMEDITLEMLAKSANVSKSECLRCFKATLQITPYRYLTEYRLSKAADLLKNTDMSIENVGLSVGFKQISHLGKRFREKTGFSPSAYRANPIEKL